MLINYINFKNNANKFKTVAQQVLTTAKGELGIETPLEVNVMLVSKCTMKKLNKKHRSVNKVTDVLSFPTLPLGPEHNGILREVVTTESFAEEFNPETQRLHLGEIVLCFPVIKKQAKLFGNTLDRELGYMMVHGFLHLLGHDHENENDKKVMREREESILSKVNLPRN